jgi:glycosyltransferase involved in cell wall biosynthesis
MHVLLVPSWYPQNPDDFNGSFFREQALAFASTGHQVGVLAVRSIAIYSGSARRARRRSIDSTIDEGLATVRADVVLPAPKAHAINYAVHYRKARAAFLDYVAQFGRPDVLHAHSVFPAAILAHRLAIEFGIPFIITEHRPSSIDRLRSGWLRENGTAAVQAADRRIAVARVFAAELTHAYGADAPWEYFPGLLSPQLEEVPVRPVPREPPFVFGHVSHLDPGKRVELLIESFADQFAGESTTILRIAGDSAQRGALEELARQRGVSDQVHFVGAVPRDSIAEEFANLHAFVLPSSAEAFGTVIWEAMARGIPVVSSRTWAGTNSVSDDVGLLFDIDDRAQLGSTLVRIRELYPRYNAERIRTQCIEHCGRDAFNALYLDAYTRAIANGPPVGSSAHSESAK